jgi:hypothetical protein
MAETAIIYLKWIYTPDDFFEEQETNLLPDYVHTIENGEVTISMGLNEYQNLPGIQEQLHYLLVSIFEGAALISRKPFTLKSPGQEIIYPDGRRHNILHVDSATMKVTAGAVDTVSKNPKDNVVSNTKQERLNKRRRLSMLSAKFRKTDPVVENILFSYIKSLHYPETELIHLYEIRDSLSKKFCGKAKAIKKLGITKSKWSMLGRLANDEPLNQGRHSGKHIGELRDATESELDEARSIAVEMVIAYLEYVDRNTLKSL